MVLTFDFRARVVEDGLKLSKGTLHAYGSYEGDSVDMEFVSGMLCITFGGKAHKVKKGRVVGTAKWLRDRGTGFWPGDELIPTMPVFEGKKLVLYLFKKQPNP